MFSTEPHKSPESYLTLTLSSGFVSLRSESYYVAKVGLELRPGPPSLHTCQDCPDCWDDKHVPSFLAYPYPFKDEETEVLKGNVVHGNGGHGSRTQAQTAWETSNLPLPCLYLSLMSRVQAGLRRAAESQRKDAVLPRMLTLGAHLVGSWGFPAQEALKSQAGFGACPEPGLLSLHG